MRGLALARLVQLGGLLVICSLSLNSVSWAAGDWVREGTSARTAFPYDGYAASAYQGDVAVPRVHYGAGGGLESRVAELEATLAEIRAEQSAARKEAAGRPTVIPGGRIDLDWAAFNQDTTSYAQIGDQQDGIKFRRARMFLEGAAFHVIDYRIEMDFAGTKTIDDTTTQATAFKDVYFEVNELPLLGHVRVGHFKEPSGLEVLGSTRFITFMERSLANEYTFVPVRDVGIMAHDTYAQENGTWAIGCFVADMGEQPPIFRDDDGGLALLMRGTYLPWYGEAADGRGLWHLGASYSYRDTPNDTARFRARPECQMADYVVDTGDIPDVPSWQYLGLETVVVLGPFSAQAEWFNAFVHRTVGEDLYFGGGYAQVSYFLTGENRNYVRSGAYFDRITPYENFFRVRGQDGHVYTGKGAWEVGYRWSYLDLSQYDSGENHPGIVQDHTIGVNWYLNPYTRVMFNYVNSTLHNPIGDGDLSIFEMRAQVDF